MIRTATYRTATVLLGDLGRDHDATRYGGTAQLRLQEAGQPGAALVRL
jgi:hypothetical protein